ncbi:MAG: SUMF1/EgtB/PvdO family nonheme iron enzyme, partial [Bryobacteraceae bacterium]
MNIRIPVALAGVAAIAVVCGMQGDRDQFVNSIGIRMIRIPAGTFQMGNDLPTDAAVLHQFPLLVNGDYDEKPVHEVRISHSFYMSETETTNRQFAAFQADHQDTGRFAPYATGVSWYEATAFCRWLSRKEKRPYRLPTEAEWEYAARAGTKTYFSSGDQPPRSGQPNAWGLKNMNTDAAEWVLDWHGLYSPDPQTDPVGPADGGAKVVRGGGIMGPSRKEPVDGALPYYRRSANRAGVAPGFRGRDDIGFRIVEAPLPETKPTEPEPKPALQFVKQHQRYAKTGPDPHKPWFRRRVLLPIPPENEPSEAIVAAGLDPSLLGHNHSAGVTACPNGDLLAIFFSASTPSSEYMANTSFVAARLRFGSDEWEMPGRFYDFPDVNEQSALLWNDRGVVRFFGGGAGLDGVPFRFQSSTDSGATWTPIEFPLLHGPLGGYAPQPINSAFRGKDGTMYMPTDAAGGESVLWASSDNGVTWHDTGGRTAGRHTTFVLLKDGSI